MNGIPEEHPLQNVGVTADANGLIVSYPNMGTIRYGGRRDGNRTLMEAIKKWRTESSYISVQPMKSNHLEALGYEGFPIG